MKKIVCAAFVVVVTALSASACSLDATQGAGPSHGANGSLGAGCQCPNSAKECGASDGNCQTGLICAAGDVSSSEQICTQPCPCPLGFVCKAVGQLGGRLLCQPG